MDDKIITDERAKLPDLGEIPPPDDDDVDEDDDEDEDEDEDDSDDEDGTKRRKKRRVGAGAGAGAGPRASTAGQADALGVGVENSQKSSDRANARKKRGRPPRVDTPMEARIKSILKGLRKLRDANGEMKIAHFEKLPDKAAMPEYFVEIQNPLAVDTIKVRTLSLCSAVFVNRHFAMTDQHTHRCHRGKRNVRSTTPSTIS